MLCLALAKPRKHRSRESIHSMEAVGKTLKERMTGYTLSQFKNWTPPRM